MKKQSLTWPLVALGALSAAAVWLPKVYAAQEVHASQDQGVTVTGCVERDAASSTAIYKIVVSQPDGSSAIYQLNAPGNSAVPAAVGKTVKISGSVSTEKRAGREIKVLTVKTLDVVADGCRND